MAADKRKGILMNEDTLKVVRMRDQLVATVMQKFPKRISQERMRFLIDNPDEVEQILLPIAVAVFSSDRSEGDWKLLHDVEPTLRSPEDIDRLELVEFLEAAEDSVDGDVIRSRAIKLSAAYGERDAEYFFRHQASAPQSLRSFHLIFPGTVRCGGDGFPRVPYLFWRGRKWGLRFHWLQGRWSRLGRLVRVKAT